MISEPAWGEAPAEVPVDGALGASLLRGFLEMRVDGLVLVGSMSPTPAITEAAATVPTVVAGRHIVLPRVDVIANDDRIGTGLAVEHLTSGSATAGSPTWPAPMGRSPDCAVRHTRPS